MLQVSELHIYPIKSLGGISLQKASLTDRGFQYDRRWMLIDAQNNFLSQRELPEMALLQVQVTEQGLIITHKHKQHTPQLVPFAATGKECQVAVWDDTCISQLVGAEQDEWFSDMLSVSCRLVYMPDHSARLVDEQYAHNREITSFADGFPLLMIGQASLDDLNSRLPTPIPMDRFRPNIVFTGGQPFEEDRMVALRIGETKFSCVKPCARCVITTIDQKNATKSKEPLKTLNTYRNRDNKVMFGQNLLYQGQGTISVGDILTVQPEEI